MIPFKQANARNYRKGNNKKNKYIVIHYTSNNGDTAKNNADYFSGLTATQSSAHYFVDENSIWQAVKDEDVAFHCGTKKKYVHPHCRNDNSIGIELCSRQYANGVYYFKPETVERAARLTATLAEKYNIAEDHIIRHHDVTGKNCPAPMVENPGQWASFKVMVQNIRAQLNNTNAESEVEDFMNHYPTWAQTTYSWIKDMPEWAQSAVSKAVKKGVVSTNPDNSVTLLGVNLQTLVWMDRAGLLD